MLQRCSSVACVALPAPDRTDDVIFPQKDPLVASLAPPLARVRAGTITTGAAVFAAVALVVRLKVFAVMLGLGGMGLIAQVSALQTLLLSLTPAFSGVALVTALANAGAESATRRDHVLAAARAFALGITVPAALLLSTGALLAGGTAFGEISGLLVAGVVGVPFGALAYVEQAALQERAFFGRLAASRIGASGLAVVAAVILTAALGPMGAALALSVGLAFSWGVTYLAYARFAGPPRLSIDPLAWRMIAAPGIAALAAAVVVGLGQAAIRLLALTSLGPEAAGIVHSLSQISTQFSLLASASLAVYATSRIAGFSSRGQRDGVRREIEAVRRLGDPGFGALLLIAAVFADPLVRALLSDEFLLAARLLPIQLLGELLLISAWLTGLYLLPLGYRAPFIGIPVLLYGLYVVLVAVLQGSVGVVAYPLAYVLACAVASAFISWHAWRTLGARAAPVTIASGIAGAGLLGTLVTPLSGLVAIALLLALGVVNRHQLRRALSPS